MIFLLHNFEIEIYDRNFSMIKNFCKEPIISGVLLDIKKDLWAA